MAKPSMLSRFGRTLADVFMSAVMWFLALAGFGGAMLVTGAYLLVGAGWSFITAGVLLIAAAAFLRRGIGHA